MRIPILAVALLFSNSALADRCALLDAQNAILELRTFEAACPPNPQGKPRRWLPAPAALVPSFNVATQVLEGPARTVGASQVTETYSVRDKTAPELDADKDAKMAAIAEAIERALCNHENRIRANKVPPDPSVTLAECRAALRKLLP